MHRIRLQNSTGKKYFSFSINKQGAPARYAGALFREQQLLLKNYQNMVDKYPSGVYIKRIKIPHGGIQAKGVQDERREDGRTL